jgi:phospholipase/carboxylesterase
MQAVWDRWGALEVVLVPPADQRPPEWMAVFCHGYGAPGTDLVGLADILQAGWEARGESVLLAFPAAPIRLDALGMPGGRAWWEINMNQLLQLAAADSFEALADTEPPGMDQAATVLTEQIEANLKRLGLSPQQLILGGFSQGAMLTVDVALRRLSEPPAGLAIYSGALICRPAWEAAAARLQSSAILQSHGRQDPILPISTGRALHRLLIEGGNNFPMLEFQGPHTIPMQALEQTLDLIPSA